MFRDLNLNSFLRGYGDSIKSETSFMISGGFREDLVKYVMHVGRLSMKTKFSPDCIIAMDKTAVWSDMTGNVTVDTTGPKDVLLKSTGNEKVKVSVCLTAKADGTKLKPFNCFSRY